VKPPNLKVFAESLAAMFVAGAVAKHPEAAPMIVAPLAALPILAEKFVDLASRYTGQRDEALALARDESANDWLLRWTKEVPRVLEEQRRQAERLEEFDARLEQRIDDPQFQRVIDNFGVEATREAIDARRRMLAHATANAFNLTLTVAEAARAERVLRELDPEDVFVLQDFRTGERDPDSPYARVGLETLIGAGCISANWGSAPGAGMGAVVTFSMTPTGRLVLRLLGSYQRPDAGAP
jgi:hypothetical protein